MAEVLRAIIAAYRELFKAATLTDGVLLSNYAMAVLVVNEVCKEVGAGRCCHYWKQHCRAMRLPASLLLSLPLPVLLVWLATAGWRVDAACSCQW